MAVVMTLGSSVFSMGGLLSGSGGLAPISRGWFTID